MTEPRRLKHVTHDPFARELLESARNDRPAAGSLQRALLSMGSAAAAESGLEQAADHAGSPASSSVSQAAPAAGAKSGVFLLSKWLGLGVLGCLTVWGVAHYAQTPGPVVTLESAKPVSPALARPFAEPPQRANGAADEPHALPFASTPAPRPATDHASHAKTRRRPKSAALESSQNAVASEAQTAPAPADDTRAQLTMLRAARAALAERAAERALAILDAFARRYESSPLAEEASVIRIDALLAAGATDQARQLAHTFLSVHPGSAYARHVRSALSNR